jgi:hypothetical protein
MIEFQPMRSLIYVDVVKEQYRHRLQHWLYKVHVPDSISQFGPYVAKYAFYNALPVPPGGERFGACRMQLTEHYWNINPMTAHVRNHAFTEVFPMDVLKWQGNLPNDSSDLNMEGDDARATGGNNGMPPFVFAFVPVWWEEDFKGKGRTVAEGPNYRWQFAMRYPEGVSAEEGDRWFYEEFVPGFAEMPEVNRFLTSRVMQEVNGCPMQRVVEMWFDGPEEWHQAAVVKAEGIRKPEWATQDSFPYLKSRFEFMSIFLTDIATSDNYSQYHGYITMR